MESIKKQIGVGLVLSGGGGKGAYEIGVWRALEEYGVSPNISAVSGTSVGALNAALFAQRDYAHAKHVWSIISPDAILTLQSMPFYGRIFDSMPGLLQGTVKTELIRKITQWINQLAADQGFFTKEGLAKLIDESIDFQTICTFPGPVYTAAFNLDDMRLEYFDIRAAQSSQSIRDRLLASASIPGVFGKTYVDGHLYWDGGLPEIGDNLPVKPLYDAGYRDLIVVHLSRELPVDQKRFPGCRIIEIMPQENLGGIRGTLNFNADQALKNMMRGYHDAVRVLAPLRSTGAALFKMKSALHKVCTDRNDFWIKKQDIDQQNMEIRHQIDSILDQYVKE